ncbi:hypothetical protein [Alkalihalophilus marmarensis]|uniref:hypothetical protein n=1 Tax=Alkalihalophilus marmarensis TaxID=521377 RepID=UPI002E1B1E43|nr:hypothetical protein [Alkalihalophilus marmarensis]
MTVTKTKGGVEEFSTQLSARIWGHRFKDGQKGPEYVLEFLNVIKGTDYDLNASSYSRNRATGLRQFIFEGDKEGAKDGVVSLSEDQKKTLYSLVQDKEEVSVIREFFRNLEVPLTDGHGKIANRSWYAKSLYPLHESLLFFEIRAITNKKSNMKTYSYERNFYARGGELFFLMLSYGTQNYPELREQIEERLKYLLKRNRAVEHIVNKISSSLKDETKKDETYPLKKVDETTKEYPFLPVDNDPIYTEFAEEFYQLISLNIDIYEMFELMISLITFQLNRYMLKRSIVHDDDEINYFFDCLDAQVAPIRKLSAAAFSDNELLVKNKFEHFFEETFKEKMPSEEFVMQNLQSWVNNPEDLVAYLGLSRLHKIRKDKVIKQIRKCKTYNDVMMKLYQVVKDIVSDQLKKNQLNIIRGLSRDGGFGGYRRGTPYRYFMTDNFIQALVYANVKPGKQTEFHTFLDQLHEKYGFVIGELQAKKSGLYEKSKINVSYFQKNELALREKLRYNGLLVEYSDATAMIRNPYEHVE